MAYWGGTTKSEVTQVRTQGVKDTVMIGRSFGAAIRRRPMLNERPRGCLQRG